MSGSEDGGRLDEGRERHECDPNGPLPKINLPGKRGFNVLMMDGAVRFISDSIPEKSLRSGIDPRDGNAWGIDE